jgi:hypothetical protein
MKDITKEENMSGGNAYSLAQWFDMPRDCNASHSDEIRERILNEAYQFTAFGVFENEVLLKTPNGRVLCTAKKIQGCSVVEFDWVETRKWARVTFWMNESSVKDLGEKIRKSPEKRCSFDELFVNE